MATTQFEELGVIRLASPCDVKWSDMKGNDQVRRCGQCELNVYDVRQLTSFEVRALMLANEGKVCMRFFRRFDGTLLTKDCPRGLELLQHVWHAHRRQVNAPVLVAPIIAAATTMLFFLAGVASLFSDNLRQLNAMAGSTMIAPPSAREGAKGLVLMPRTASNDARTAVLLSAGAVVPGKDQR